MQGKIETFEFDSHQIWVYAPKHLPTKPLPVIYSMAGEAMPEEIPLMLRDIRRTCDIETQRPFIAVSFTFGNWNHTFSPWPAPSLFHNDEPFTGGGSETLEFLLRLKTEIDSRYPTSPIPADNFILGYSLSALFALWVLYETDAFGGCGACSGSLWYEGWLDYLNTHTTSAQRIYLSLGRKEEKTRNLRSTAVGDATRETARLLADNPNITSTLIWHDGGHTHQVIQRVAQALLWLLRE